MADSQSSSLMLSKPTGKERDAPEKPDYFLKNWRNKKILGTEA